MALNQTMTTPIQQDPNGVDMIAHEAPDGSKAVPVVLVTPAGGTLSIADALNLAGMNAADPFSAAADTTHVFAQPMRGFVIINDGSAALTFTISGYTFTVLPGEGFSESFAPFTEVTVTTAVPFRAYGKW